MLLASQASPLNEQIAELFFCQLRSKWKVQLSFVFNQINRPTTDVRDALVRNLAKQAEDTRAAIRKTHQAAQKKLKGLGYDGKGGAIQDVSVPPIFTIVLTARLFSCKH